MGNDPEANDAVAPMVDMMKRLQETGASQLPGMGAHWLETMSAIGSQMLTFMSERVQKDVQTQHDVLHAKGMAEVQHIQARFLQRAMTDYTDEMAKLIELDKSLAPDLQTDSKTPKS